MQNRAEKRADVPTPSASADGNSTPLTFRRGACIVQEGEEVTGVYRVIAGSVSLMKRGDDGELYSAGTVIAGDIIGIQEILNDGQYGATAVAARVTSALFIPKQAFLEMVRCNPSIVVQAMKRVCERLGELERKIEAAA